VQQLTATFADHGVWLVFFNVLVVQLGVPVPAYPTMIVAGALVARGELPAAAVILAALSAALVADFAWYLLGRKHGRSVLNALCRMSLSPDACVRQTEAIFTRFGMRALVASKFITGFSTVAPPLVGVMRVPPRTFLVYDALGCLLWVGSAVGIGLVFHGAVESALEFLAGLGRGALVLAGGALVLFVLYKWWQRQRFYKVLRMARITVDELRDLMQREPPPVVVDVRTEAGRRADPRRIPGATVLDLSAPGKTTDGELPLEPVREIILYCT